MKAWFSLVLLVGGCGIIPGTACTEIGCADGLSLSLDVGSPLPDGAWEVTMAWEDGPVDVCPFTISNAELTPDASCSAFEVFESDGKILLQFLDAEGDVGLTVTRDGTELLSEDLSPVYEESRPNGPNCPPVCRNALVERTIEI